MRDFIQVKISFGDERDPPKFFIVEDISAYSFIGDTYFMYCQRNYSADSFCEVFDEGLFEEFQIFAEFGG